MINQQPNDFKWAPFVVLVVVAVAVSMGASTGRQSLPVVHAAVGADLTNEARLIDAYSDDLNTY